MRFAKGHGTGNDFVVLPDPDGALDLTPDLVRRLCDRRFGIGGDGVLRVVRSAKHPDAVHLAGEAGWFMDYHNADGSLSEMCGNGVRVFARYLTGTGLVDAAVFPIATRAGVVTALVAEDEIAVDMVPPVLGPPSSARHHRSGRDFPGTSVSVGNPHLVCPVDDLASLDLSAPPGLDPRLFPDGANVEFVVPAEPVPDVDLHVRMRVYERGSAETLSCGSGAVAVAAVAIRDAGLVAGTVAVDLPGGRLTVVLAPDRCALAGPAVIVATGEVTL
ncbi:MAG: diaminopimelate epimerase [Actinobacteria bacterium 13_2_20CM_2_71_6]|nr:MAG: diaminopimelate epimerase [Actinobacteria bacterium 13_2_20CM_2_71_6]